MAHRNTSRARLGALFSLAAVSLPAALSTGTTSVAAAPSSAAAAFTARTFTLGGTVQATAGSPGGAAPGTPETPQQVGGGGPAGHSARLAATAPALATPAAASATAATTVRSFDGINHFAQRTANGGNQFSLEPPDQGLCANSSFVFESVNDAVRTFDPRGRALTATITLNQFYGYPPNINRTTGSFGPFPFDPSCYFDEQTGRFFQLVNTLAADPVTGANSGVNELTLAVSKTGDPTGAWFIYHLPVQDDGTAGTPDHHCTGTGGTGHGPCFGDYPHLGADGNALVMTTNEYSFLGPEFKGAQVYAVSKWALASGAASPSVFQFDTRSAGPNHEPGFTLWPATSPGTGQFETASNGTEYLLSSDATVETGNTTGASTNLIAWALSNTASLRTSAAAPRLSNTVLTVQQYSIPPHSQQKAGHTPLMDCLNDASHPTPFGLGCWRLLGLTAGPYAESPASLDSNDTRMQQVTFVNGQLVGALDTALLIRGQSLAGIELFDVAPTMRDSGITATLAHQAYYGAAGLNVIYPTLGITASGRGVMGFTAVGKTMYPSAAYASFSLARGPGAMQITGAGAGPQDGFSGYFAFAGPGQNERPRWGDYGASSVVGNQVWLANEYIGQTCTLAQYMQNTAASPFGTCHDTRTALANWDTRISLITP